MICYRGVATEDIPAGSYVAVDINMETGRTIVYPIDPEDARDYRTADVLIDTIELTSYNGAQELLVGLRLYKYERAGLRLESITWDRDVSDRALHFHLSDRS